jgi:hypothetical protein
MQYIPLKRRRSYTRLHGLTSQKKVYFFFMAVRTSNLRPEYTWRIGSVVSRNKACDDIGKICPLQPLGDVIPIFIYLERRNCHNILEEVADASRDALTVE